jgi:iron complex outermembrane receptor protein/vitamin B12 transporter
MRRYTAAPFFEVRATTPIGLVLEGAIRGDFTPNFPSNLSPRIGFTQQFVSTGTTLRANWGKGFHLPSFFALGNPIVGNPKLKAETSKNVDLGLTQELWGDIANVGLTVFASRYRNLIDFDSGPPPRLVNRSNVTSKGVEIELGARPFDCLHLTSQLSYAKTTVSSGEQELRRRPKWRAGINALWNVRPDLDLNTSAFYVGRILDSSIPTGDRRLSSYARLDLAATWRATSNVQLGIAVENLTGAKYEEAIGFSSSGIRPQMFLRYNFGY